MSTSPQLQKPTAEPEPLARHTTACPECSETLVEGQGVVTCTDCRWTGRYE